MGVMSIDETVFDEVETNSVPPEHELSLKTPIHRNHTSVLTRINKTGPAAGAGGK
jgi:hypothetical protein